MQVPGSLCLFSHFCFAFVTKIPKKSNKKKLLKKKKQNNKNKPPEDLKRKNKQHIKPEVDPKILNPKKPNLNLRCATHILVGVFRKERDDRDKTNLLGNKRFNERCF